jgi:hypothetical protein
MKSLRCYPDLCIYHITYSFLPIPCQNPHIRYFFPDANVVRRLTLHLSIAIRLAPLKRLPLGGLAEGESPNAEFHKRSRVFPSSNVAFPVLMKRRECKPIRSVF